MAYDAFSLEELKERFGLRVSESGRLFDPIPAVPVSDLLRAELEENTPLALAISTEKQGMNQCIAEMVAAELFNSQRQKPVSSVYGAVTTGSA